MIRRAYQCIQKFCHPEVSLQIERNMIVVRVFLLIRNQPEFSLVHNQKENCHYDHIPFDLKGIQNRYPENTPKNVEENIAIQLVRTTKHIPR